MKMPIGKILIIFCFIPVIILAQNPGGREIAINESDMSYLEQENSDFANTYSFDTRFNTFKETYRKTFLYQTPELKMQDIVKPIPRTSVVKAYRLLKNKNVWAVKFENDWGFIDAEDLIPIEEYEEPIVNDNLDSPPKLLSKFTFKYPHVAKKDSISGEVVLRILVSNTGAVSKVEVEKSIPPLDSAAIDAVSKLRFKPAKKFGMPTDVWVRVPLNFEIN